MGERIDPRATNMATWRRLTEGADNTAAID